MKWYKKLYSGESVKQPKWARFQIVYGKKPKRYYCIALSANDHNLLDIYESRFLKTPGMDTENIYVLGIAGEKAEAFEVVRQIIEDVYIHTGGFDIKQYLGIRL